MLYEELISYIRENYLPEEKLKVAKDGTETLFFRKGGKSLCYIENKDLKYAVTVVIGASLNEKVQSANLSQKVKEKFLNAKQFHDGKWLFIELVSSRDLEDIKSLLSIKKPVSVIPTTKK